MGQDQPPQQPSRRLTVKQAAEHAAVSVHTVYTWLHLRLLPHYRMPGRGKGLGRIKIDQTALEAFLQAHKVEVPVPPPPKKRQHLLTEPGFPKP